MVQSAIVDRFNGIISCPTCKETMANLTLMEAGDSPPVAFLGMTSAGDILQCLNPEIQHRFKVYGIRDQEVSGYEEVLVEEVPVTPDIPEPTRGDGGGKELEHFIATGEYLYKGVEYSKPPHQLEVDTGRGVLYLHNLMSGQTALRVCQIPDDLVRLFEVGTVVIDLIHTPVRHGGESGKIVKKEPVFMSISGTEELLARQPLSPGGFTIEDEASLVYFEFRNVPGNLLDGLWRGNFVDITLGYTGRTQ